MELNVFDLYQRCLMPLTPTPAVMKLLQVYMEGGETTDDFAQILSLDPEVLHWIRLTVQRLGFEKRASKPVQMIILLGQNRIRDTLIGRSIERAFIKPEETLLGKLQAEKAKAEEAKPSTPAPEAPPAPAASPEAGAAPPAAPGTPAAAAPPQGEEALEIIPAIADFQKYLEYAVRAEDIALQIRNSYPGQAFAGGVLFDYIRFFLKSVDTSKLETPALKNPLTFIEEIFKDGIRGGIAANEIIQKISIPHQKNVFVTALVHNIGKAILLAFDPPTFEKAFKTSTGQKDAKKRTDSSEAEMNEFEFDHAQLGALYLGRLPFLAEIERPVDFHHNPHLLKFSSPKLYALSSVVRVSGALAKLYQRNRGENPDTERMPDSRIRNSEEFKFLKLNDQDWSSIKSNYALKLMKVGL